MRAKAGREGWRHPFLNNGVVVSAHGAEFAGAFMALLSGAAAPKPYAPGTGTRAIALLVMCAAVLVILIVGGTAGAIINARERALVNGERELNNVALMLAPQI